MEMGCILLGKKLLNIFHDGYIHVRVNPVGSQMIITIKNHTVDRLRLVECESGGYGEEHGENKRNTAIWTGRVINQDEATTSDVCVMTPPISDVTVAQPCVTKFKSV